MAWESSLVTHCLVKIPLHFIWHLLCGHHNFWVCFPDDLTLADDWCWPETTVLDSTGRFTSFVCVEQNNGCADRQEFSFLVQAVFDSAVSLSGVWVLAFPTTIDSSLRSLVYFHQILCFFIAEWNLSNLALLAQCTLWVLPLYLLEG